MHMHAHMPYIMLGYRNELDFAAAVTKRPSKVGYKDIVVLVGSDSTDV